MSTHAILRRFAPALISRIDPMTKTLCVRVLAVATFFCASAQAADAPTGVPAAGRALIYTCNGCHGVTGYENAYPQYHVPRIAGQNYEYIVAALTGYKKGERAHPTMRAQGESLSDQDIVNIA